MENIYISAGGVIIKITFHHFEPPYLLEREFKHRLEKYFEGFLLSSSTQKNHFEIEIRQNNTTEIFTKNKKIDLYIKLFEQISTIKYNAYYHLSDEQFYILIRTILQKKISNGSGVIMHGSAVEVNKKSNIFLGQSGAGKSTIMKILSKYENPLADDSFILKKEKSKIFFYCTPAKEKNSWFKKNSTNYPVKNIFILRKALYHDITKIVDKEMILPLLLNQLYTNEESIQPQSEFVMKLTNKIENIFFLDFKLEQTDQLYKLIKQYNA